MDKALFNQVGEVKGEVSDSADSFSFQFTPQNENLRRTRGSLFTLVTIIGKADSKIDKAKAYYHAFQSSYYAKATGSIINGLSETLDHVEKEFARKEGEEEVKYSLVAAVFWGAVLYLAKIGSNSVFVSRAGKLKKLDFTKVASGVLEDQDTVCLATESFSNSINQEELAELLGAEKFETVLEKIDKRIAEIEGAVCDVIRLSVNAPEETIVPTQIGEVDEKGDLDLPKEPTSGEDANPQEENQTEESISQVASVNQAIPLQTKQTNNLLTTAKKLGQNLLTALVTVIKPLVSWFLKPWRKTPPGDHVDHVAIRRQRIIQVVVIIVIVLFGSLIFSLTTGANNKNQEKISTLISSAKQNLTEAKSIKSIDPNRATSLVNQAKKSTEQAKKLDPKNKEVTDLESEEASLLAEINRSYNLSKLKTVADFTKITKEVKLSRLSLRDNIILATDKDNNNIFSLDLTSQNVSQVEGSFTKPNNLASYSNGFYIQTDSGIVKLDQNNKASSIANGSTWGEIVGAATYQNNLYLLDKGKEEVWKYIATSTGLASPRAYLQGEKPNLKDAAAIAIDGFVWLTTKKGEIFKIAVGKKQEFSLTNMQEAFSNVTDIYTDSDSKNLYLLDSGKGRVVVVSKDGVYQSQYSSSELHQATSLVVYETQKTAYVAVNGKILSVSLK